ncbi:MAG: hypothetical protein FJ171_09055 [Gammaproteobacteria bacterium]|nr:hypothetical protein [Gammaproteobacteria bacterium]
MTVGDRWRIALALALQALPGAAAAEWPQSTPAAEGVDAAALGDLESSAAEAYFGSLLTDAGIGVPADWRERVRVGSDREQSGTARENLRGQESEVPAVLPDTQKQLVDFAVPGLRRILGYA